MKWMDKIIELKIRIDAGNGAIYWMKNLIIIIAAIKYIFNPSLLILIFLVPAGIIGLYLLGWLLLDILKFNQREAEIQTEKYNYYFKKLKRSVHRTTRKV